MTTEPRRPAGYGRPGAPIGQGAAPLGSGGDDFSRGPDEVDGGRSLGGRYGGSRGAGNGSGDRRRPAQRSRARTTSEQRTARPGGPTEKVRRSAPGVRRRPAGRDPAGRGGSGGPGGRDGNGDGRGRRRASATKKPLWRKIVNWKTILLTFLGIIVAIFGVIFYAYANTEIPDPNADTNYSSSIVYWNDGQTELHRFASVQREPVSLNQIPKHVQDAVIAAEDRTFWTNDGFDPVGIARAAWDTLREGEIAGGGSTITQQYVKNFYLTKEQTITRKIKELFISVKVDQSVSKEKILEDYLNTIFWGRGTVHGVQTAAHSYFGKDVGELTVEEGIALAAFIRKPDLYDPTLGDDEEKAANAARFAERFRFVANGMVEVGALTQAQADKLQPPEVKPRDRSNSKGGTNGYLIDVVERQLRELGFSEQEIYGGGLRIVTTYDQKAQQAAVDAVAEQFPVDEAGEPLDPELHVGLAGVDPETGALLGFYGGADFVERAWNDAVLDSKLEPGSTMKPFGVAAALENDISLQSRFYALSELKDPRIGEDDTIRNQGGAHPGSRFPDGKITLLEGLVRSTNTVFADLSLQFNDRGVVMKESLTRAGIPLEDVCGATSPDEVEDEECGDLASDKEYRTLLGPFGTPVVEVAEAYATLASGGVHNEWHVVERVTEPGGGVRYEAEPEHERVYEADVVADTTYALSQVVEDTRAGTANVALELGRPVAAKTGTHEDYTAAFTGYTPQLAAAVIYYKGNGANQPENSLRSVPGFEDGFSGGNVPGKTWTAFMQKALEGEPVVPFPEPANLGEDRTPEPTATTAEPTPSPTPTAPEECPEGYEGEYPSCVLITPEVDVPDVRGMSQAEAEQALANANLVAEVEHRERNGAPEEGVVVRQDPRAGRTVYEETTVKITVEIPPEEVGQVEVPDVSSGTPKYLTFEEAQSILNGVGLHAVPGPEVEDCNAQAGTVFFQDPKAGDEVSAGTEVYLSVWVHPDSGCDSG